ncbi:MAG: bifunctional nuclease family protein [Chloroflexi bacterium]|nr:MAG: bifunctional nuclease family protein [Chloroflexota bacterium]
MIEVTVDSIRVSLISQHRVVVLKELNSDRYLPIWIGPFEADAITIALQGVDIPRPLTHDLLKRVIDEVGGVVSHILVNDLRDDTFYARIVMDVNGRHSEIDSRPSDAIALAVRAQVPIYVVESVMERAGIEPAEDEELHEDAGLTPEEEEKLDVFREFVETLDLESLGDDDESDED